MLKRIVILVLLGVVFFAGTQLPHFFGQAFGQFPQSIAAPAQVVVNQQTGLPRCVVDFTPLDDPANPARKLRVITVVDTETKVISVYHMEPATGVIRWLSTRDIQPDLRIRQFNAAPPLPSEVEREIQRLQKQN